jgi:hypothetical protein
VQAIRAKRRGKEIGRGKGRRRSLRRRQWRSRRARLKPIRI